MQALSFTFFPLTFSLLLLVPTSPITDKSFISTAMEWSDRFRRKSEESGFVGLYLLPLIPPLGPLISPGPLRSILDCDLHSFSSVMQCKAIGYDSVYS